MNSLVVLVAMVASLVHAAPHWGGVPLAHAGYAHAGYAHAGYAHTPVWHGPQNIPVVLPSGHLADTHEVSALKAAHAVAVAHTPGAHGGHGHFVAPAVHAGHGHVVVPAAHGHAYAGAHHGVWHGPQNIPVVLPSGHLADTPEVAHLKAAHIARLHGAHY